MDAILSYHLNPLTCGIARFNRALGQEMGLPCIDLFGRQGLAAKRPLLSIKINEFAHDDAERLSRLVDDPALWPRLRLFLHDYDASAVEAKLVRKAERIYCGNERLHEELSSLHRDAVLAWCPGYLFDTRPLETSAEISIYTFGMAHKLRADYFYRLRDLLLQTDKSFIVYVSAAIHEGRSLDENFTSAYEELAECFGDRVRFLGFISDGALHHYLKTCTYFAAFFQNGVRANNTSVNTAMQCESVVLTNLDTHSPPELAHMVNVIDIKQCRDGLPTSPDELDRVRAGGKAFAEKMGWGPLVDLINRHEAR